MKVQKIPSSSTFQSGKNISKNMQSRLRTLTKWIKDSNDRTDGFTTGAVSLKNTARFALGEYELVSTDGLLSTLGKNTVRIDLKGMSLVVDNLSGKIVEHNKPFFYPWFKLLKDADKYLIEVMNNFGNTDKVSKQSAPADLLPVKKIG